MTIDEIRAKLAALTSELAPLNPDIAAAEALASVQDIVNQGVAEARDVLARATANMEGTNALAGQVQELLAKGGDLLANGNALVSEMADVLNKLETIQNELNTAEVAAAVAALPEG